MAGQGPRALAHAAMQKGKSPTSTKKPELAAIAVPNVDTFLAALEEQVDDGELSCASVESVSEDLAALVINSWSTLLNSGASSHLIKSRE